MIEYFRFISQVTMLTFAINRLGRSSCNARCTRFKVSKGEQADRQGAGLKR